MLTYVRYRINIILLRFLLNDLIAFSYYFRVYGTYIILCTCSYRPYLMYIFLQL